LKPSSRTIRRRMSAAGNVSRQPSRVKVHS
jgi:hypothetical protein